MFADLFLDTLRIKREGLLTPTMTIADVNTESFKEMLRYLYSGIGECVCTKNRSFFVY